MVKITIPEERKEIVQRNRLEIDVQIGDLILLTNDMLFDDLGNRKFAYFGVFKDLIQRRPKKIDLGNYYILRRCEKFGGIDLPLVEPKCGLISLSCRLKDFYVGQENIVRALLSWQGFEPYTEYVAKLRKPY